jgi:hypothetical protein
VLSTYYHFRWVVPEIEGIKKMSLLPEILVIFAKERTSQKRHFIFSSFQTAKSASPGGYRSSKTAAS